MSKTSRFIAVLELVSQTELVKILLVWGHFPLILGPVFVNNVDVKCYHKVTLFLFCIIASQMLHIMKLAFIKLLLHVEVFELKWLSDYFDKA